MWRILVAALLPVMTTLQQCPDQRPAPPSGVILKPHQGILINNVQWVHVPVLINLTAWSPDIDQHCAKEAVTTIYKDLITTAFLKYHSTVRANYYQSSFTPAHPERKRRSLLGSILGATSTDLGISNWMDNQQMRKSELKLREMVATQILKTDAFLQEGLKEEGDSVKDVHIIASALSIFADGAGKAFNGLHKELYCAQFAAVKYSEISQILQDIISGRVPAGLITEEVVMKWFGFKECFVHTPSEDLKTYMRNLGKCNLPIPYGRIIEMAKVTSHPIPAGFYSPLDYGPLMEGIFLPFSAQGGKPSNPSKRTPPIQIIKWWNETIMNNINDKSWACSAGHSLKQFGCFMRQMYAMLLTISIPIFQAEQVFDKIVKVESLGILQENVLKERKDLPQFITQLKTGEWRVVNTECCNRTPYGYLCECDAVEKKPLCGMEQGFDEKCEVSLKHIHNNFTRVIIQAKDVCITTNSDHFYISLNNSEIPCPILNTSFCMTPKTSWSIGSYRFPFVNISQQTLAVEPEEELGFVETIPEFDFQLPQLDRLIMNLMQRKDTHIIKAQEGLKEKDKTLLNQMHDGDLEIAYSGTLWEFTFKGAVLLCICLAVIQLFMICWMCTTLKQQRLMVENGAITHAAWFFNNDR